jgi:hypothetical protein
MRQFLAILKDSFREAVDGFVIYAMLGLSALLILVAASMSFTPVPPDQAFSRIVPQFNLVIPEKGRSRSVSFGDNVSYAASDVQPASGGYKLRLTATGTSRSQKSDSTGKMTHDPGGGDSFRATVARWSAKAGATVKVPDGGGKDGKKGKGVEVSVPTQSSAEEQRAVTDAQMEEFIKYQFSAFAGMDAAVTRVKTGVEEPVYAFEVTTSGGSAVRGWPHATKIFFGAFTLDDETPLGGMLWVIEDIIINRFGGTLALLVGMIITAFFIPNMLRKGSVDLMISKPIGRSQLLIYKYIGGLTFMFLVTAFTVGGIWFVLAVRSGYWNPAFLGAIPVLTFTFAILYAVSTLVAVFTRSAVAAMLITVGFAFFLFIVGQIKGAYDDNRAADPDRQRSPWVAFLIDNGHDVLPRTRELDLLIRRLITEGTLTPAMQRIAVQNAGEPAPLVETFGVSLAHIVAMLGLSCWWFSKRDY